MTEMKPQIQEAQRKQNRIMTPKSTPRHITFKTTENQRQKENPGSSLGVWGGGVGRDSCTYKTRERITEDISSETINHEMNGIKHDQSVERKKNNHQPRILYPAKLSFKSEGEIKTSSDKQKLRELIASRPAL